MQIGIPEIEKKYEILELMGEGGMGSIYRARHRYLDEIRVIKTIRPQLVTQANVQARFLGEAKVAAKLRHPNIASIYDFTMTEEGTACIVMEYIDGQNLRQIQRERGRLAATEVLPVARQVLDALSYLHSRQFVHRDISTDNLMLGTDDLGQPKATLIDLGLAKSLEAPDAFTQTGTVVGKVHYIAPEQLSRGAPGVTIDGRCDLYSFGVVLYELLTKHLPIAGDDHVSLIAGHLHRAPLSFDVTDPEGLVPPSIRSVVLRALAKKPEHRFASAADLAEALEEAGSGIDLPVDVGEAATRTMAMGGAEAATEVAQRRGRPELGEAVDATEVLDTGGLGSALRTAFGRPFRSLGRSGRRMAAIAITALVLVGAALVGWRWRANAPSIGSGATNAMGATAEAPADQAVSELGDIFFGRNHALLIGNNAYRLLPQLETAVNDVRAIGAVLERRYGFSVTVVENATRTETIDALSAITSSMTARDNLLVYYAGHGNIEFNRESWQPVDAAPDDTTNWISTQHEISSPLARSSARHVLVISDSCYAGAAATEAVDSQPSTGADRSDVIRQLTSRSSRMVMTSGGLSPVLDQGDGHLSIFARALLEVLEDGSLRGTSEIFGALQPRVLAAARAFDFEQQPTLAAIPRAGDEGGELFFVPTPSS